MQLPTFLRKFYQWIDRRFTLRNFLRLSLILLVTLGLLEIAARIFLTGYLEKSTQRKFRFEPYRIYGHVPGFAEGDLMRINGQGFRRDEEVSKEKGDQVRILLMGGSAAHGASSSSPYPIAHLSQEQTIDAHLEDMLSERWPGKQFEVINTAVTGYQVSQHTPYLITELLGYQPDLVIFFDGYNDHFTVNPDHDYFADNPYQFWTGRLREPSIAGGFDYLAMWASDFSALARGYLSWRLQRDALARRDHSSMIYHQFDSDAAMIKAHRKAAPKQFLASIRNNLNVLADNQVEALLCLQPILVLRSFDQLSEEEKAFFDLSDDSGKQVLYPVVVEELEQTAEEFGVSFLDLNRIFNQTEWSGKQLFIDYCHLAPEGAKACARALIPGVEESLGL